MKTCFLHEIVYQDYKGRDKQNCPVCESESEIRRHEETNEDLRRKNSIMADTLVSVLHQLSTDSDLDDKVCNPQIYDIIETEVRAALETNGIYL